jgi:flagellar hook-basal body complex protein FliE
MNIQVTQINNGFIVAVQAQTSTGQQSTATFVPNFSGVVDELKEIQKFADSQHKEIIPGSPEDR